MLTIHWNQIVYCSAIITDFFSKQSFNKARSIERHSEYNESSISVREHHSDSKKRAQNQPKIVEIERKSELIFALKTKPFCPC